MFVLLNYNLYLGGGETLFVRFANYLYRCKIPFHAYCRKGSFISKQLCKDGVPKSYYSCISSKIDYPYLSKSERELLLSEIERELPESETYRYVSFCLRELYLLVDLNKRHHGSISHLILHNQDYLYLGRTVLDVLLGKLMRRKMFHNNRNLKFNRQILQLVNQHQGIIPMSLIITQLWRTTLGLEIPEDMIVPLPAFDASKHVLVKAENNKKLIWIGRLVNFKFASLFAMLNYIKRNPSYYLTIVGDGDKKRVQTYIERNLIPVDNVCFAGEVSYSDLSRIISEHAIGYASGTSIIECVQQGMPVIMALQYNVNKPFKRDICGGLFYHTTKGNLGEDLCICSENDITTTIDDAIQEIERDYSLAASRCYEYAQKEYSNELNFAGYIQKIVSTRQIDTKDMVVPLSPRIRRCLFYGNI